MRDLRDKINENEKNSGSPPPSQPGNLIQREAYITKRPQLAYPWYIPVNQLIQLLGCNKEWHKDAHTITKEVFE